jgi:hypothetical protein
MDAIYNFSEANPSIAGGAAMSRLTVPDYERRNSIFANQYLDTMGETTGAGNNEFLFALDASRSVLARFCRMVRDLKIEGGG